MNRIDLQFKKLRRQKKKAFIAFITAGDPDLKATKDLVLSFAKAGVDVIELGVPFSDPLADGPTIQASSQRALRAAVTLPKIFKLVQEIRRTSQIPIALMSYYNPIFHFGEDRFVAKARKLGVDGVIIPDLPPEEAGSFIRMARKNDFAMIFFLSPTTTRNRLRRIVRASTGFIYYVSLTGITGARKRLPENIFQNVTIAKAQTPKPICVGFGVSRPEQIRKILKVADGVIVGSALIDQIVKNTGRRDLVKNVTDFARRLVHVSKGPFIQ